MNIKNDAQLKKLLMAKCSAAISNAEEKVYNKFSDNLDIFYSEFNPEEYIRTHALLNSLESTGVKKSGNQYGSYIKAKVYFNTPDYEMGLVPLQHTPEHGMYGWASYSGEEVLATAMEGSKPHGDYARGTRIWTKTMKNLGGEKGIKNLIKQELKNQGL